MESGPNACVSQFSPGMGYLKYLSGPILSQCGDNDVCASRGLTGLEKLLQSTGPGFLHPGGHSTSAAHVHTPAVYTGQSDACRGRSE